MLLRARLPGLPQPIPPPSAAAGTAVSTPPAATVSPTTPHLHPRAACVTTHNALATCAPTKVRLGVASTLVLSQTSTVSLSRQMQTPGTYWKNVSSNPCTPFVPFIEHCFTVVTNYATSFVPVDRHQSSNRATTSWISRGVLSSTGAPFIYAILTASSLYRLATGSGSPQDVLQYKISAISEINHQLNDSTAQIDDNNIAAVFMLLCIEEGAVSSNNEDVEWATLQRKLHLDGLKTMINQRGGLSALGSNQCLQTFILM